MRWLVALHGGGALPGGELAATSVRTAHAARDNGYHGVVVGQHFLTGPESYLQPIPLLSRLVPETGDMDLVLGVLLLPFLHPVQLAEELGTLDALSGGRLIVGVGQGYRDVEFEAFGVDRSRRLRVQLDHLDQLRSWWAAGHTAGPSLAMPPTRRPHPPLWYAAGSPPTYKRALARGMVPYIGPQAVVSDIDALVTENERPHEVALRRDVMVTDVVGPERARRALAEHARRYAKWGYAMQNEAQSPYVIGEADECRAEIERLAEHGITQVVLRTNWPEVSSAESLEMLAALRS